MMHNIAFLMKEGSMGFDEVIHLPYAVFLSLLKHFMLFELMKDPAYQEEIKKQEILSQREPDWDRLKPLVERR